MRKADFIYALERAHHFTDHYFRGKVFDRPEGASWSTCILCYYQDQLLQLLNIDPRTTDDLGDVPLPENVEYATTLPTRLKLTLLDTEHARVLLQGWMAQLDENARIDLHSPVLIEVPLDDPNIRVRIENRLNTGFVRRQDKPK